MADKYIERGALLAAYDKEHEGEAGRARKLIEDAPAADVVPVRHGRWERHWARPRVYADLLWHCSVCGYKNAESYADTYHHYCPNCGAKMDGET